MTIIKRFDPAPSLDAASRDTLTYLESRHPIVEIIARVSYYPQLRFGHTHPDVYQLEHCIAGSAVFQLGGHEISTAPDLFFLIPPGRSHNFPKASADLRSFSCRFALPGFTGEFLPEVLRVELSTVFMVRQLFESACQVADASASVFTVSLRFAEVLAALAQARPLTIAHPDCSPVVDEGIRFMETRFADGIGVGEAATHAGVSIHHFCRLFKKEMGQSPLTFLRHLRLSHALDRLTRSRENMPAVAAASGFENAAKMASAFRRLIGMTPQEYRRRHDETPS